MNNFYIGQKVRYLNQVGEGTIKNIKGETANVEDKSGFEMPFALSELVPANKDEIIVNQIIKSDINISTKPSENNTTKKFLSDGVYLVFAPLKNQNMDVILINNSGFDIAINIFLTNKNTNNFVKNIFINNEVLKQIVEIDATAIADWQNISAHIMFSKVSLKTLPKPVSVSKRIDGKKFFDTKNYVLTPYHQLPVFDVCIYSETMQETDIDVETLKSHFNQKENNTTSKISLPHYIHQHDLEKEIDLHIEELVDNYSIYTPSALLQIQMNKVKDELSKAIAKPLTKITFIHGVGKGVLKQELINYLSKTEGIKFYDGAYSKYGFGATTVEIL